MLQAFVIVLREGFEAFLIVSVIASYLQRTRRHLLPAVGWGIGASLVVSGGLGYALQQRGFDPLWEGILGLVAVFLVSTLVIQMWRHARFLKKDTEQKLESISQHRSGTWAAAAGVFLFTVLMVSREGIETALLLTQVHDPAFLTGVGFGLLCTALLCLLWVRASRLINLKLFFQVTSIFLLLFLAQVCIYALHELSEAGVLPDSEAFHLATEPFSPDGLYGKWFSVITVAVCMGWLLLAWLRQRIHPPAK